MSSDIDPQLPYIQVHRGVGPKAAQLATALEVTYQHARGSLDVFWESLADRRLLVENGKAKEELVLPAKDLEMRLKLAFGKPVELSLMEALGFLQSREGGAYRIRGASRMLNVEAGRLKKKSGGTHLPSETNPGVVLMAPELDPGRTQDATPVRPRSDPTEVRGERREVKGERTDLSSRRRGDLERGKTSPSPEDPSSSWENSGDAFFDAHQVDRVEAGWVEEKRPENLATWWAEVMRILDGDADRLKAALFRFNVTPHWSAKGYPFVAFMSEWRVYDRPPPPAQRRAF